MLTEPVRCQVLAAAVATSTAISLEGFQACAGDTAARSWPPPLTHFCLVVGGNRVKFGKEKLDGQ